MSNIFSRRRCARLMSSSWTISHRNPVKAATPALARTWFDKGPAPVTRVSAPWRNASATMRSRERTLLPPNATGRRSSRLNKSCGPPIAAERRGAWKSAVGSLTSPRRGKASNRCVHDELKGGYFRVSPARFGRPTLGSARYAHRPSSSVDRAPPSSAKQQSRDPPQWWRQRSGLRALPR
jgi:hypothetical protein